MITSNQELKSLITRAVKLEAVTLDTEFLWERTYFPRLALVQLAFSSQECFLIDPLAIKDLSPLGELLADQNTVKILHDAPQDLAILHRATGAEPANIFDTRLAAGFCGLPYTISLADLVSQLLGINLDKSETRTNWLKRPLTKKQISYALDDVRYLKAAMIVLQKRIYSPEVSSFLDEELQSFDQTLSYHGMNDSQRYTKVQGAKGLKRKSLAVLRELAAWREKQAMTEDKPRGHIVPDKVLTNIARNLQAEPAQIVAESGISKNAAKKYLAQIVKCVEKGLQCREKDYPASLKTTRLTEKNKKDLNKLSIMLKLKSDTKGIDPQLIGNTADLKYFVKNLDNPEKLAKSKLYQGWRKNFISEFLL